LTTTTGGRALVTGGTGGIGEEVCRGLAARGYDVYVGARDPAKGEAVAARLREEFPGAHKCVVCDLNEGEAALPRGVNLLVNNAGVMGAATDETMRVNLLAPARLTLGLRARNRKLRVVNVASSSHLRARACPVARMLDDRRRDKSLSAYAASKLGLLQFTAALRNNGVDARACHPGLVWTPSVVRVRRQGAFDSPRRRGSPSPAATHRSTKHRMLKGFFPKPVRALLPRRLFKTPSEGAATVLLACVDEEAGTYYMDSGDRPTAASPECSETSALVDELGALGLNIT
jgi:NAD(P)-dependent dehydrogenase (short-subunit alcohol dehydrogenase family)